MLVATNVIPRRITDVSTVPSIPASRTGRIEHIHSRNPDLPKRAVAISVTARYPMATPKSTHKNAGVTVIVAVIRKNAAITPIIAAAITENVMQLGLQLQLLLFIYFHLPSQCMLRRREVTLFDTDFLFDFHLCNLFRIRTDDR